MDFDDISSIGGNYGGIYYVTLYHFVIIDVDKNDFLQYKLDMVDIYAPTSVKIYNLCACLSLLV